MSEEAKNTVPETEQPETAPEEKTAAAAPEQAAAEAAATEQYIVQGIVILIAVYIDWFKQTGFKFSRKIKA